MVEKAVNVEIKANLELPSDIKEINFRHLKDYRPTTKKDKDKANWEHQNRNKAKSVSC